MNPDSRKWLYMVLSVLLSTAFWFYVRNTQDIEISTIIRNIPVTLYGEQVLEDQGMTVSDLSEGAVSINITATQSVIRRLRSDNITATVDVSRCSTPDKYPLTYTITYPSGVSGSDIQINERTPSNITVTVEKLNSKTFLIEPRLQGSIAQGFQAGSWSLSQDTVIASGALEQLNRVAKIEAVVEEENLTERFSGDVPLTLVDAEGNVLTDADVKLSISTVYVTLPVVVVRDIPLSVNLISGGGASADDCEPVFSPADSISVSGAMEDLAGLEEISLGNIDLAKVVGTSTFTFSINLDPSLDNVSGFGEVMVTVTINNLATRTLDVGNIQLINAPDGAQRVTQSCQVVLRGEQEVLDRIDASQIRIVADLSDVTARGSFTVPVRVYLNAPDSVGVIGDYTIAVNLP